MLDVNEVNDTLQRSIKEKDAVILHMEGLYSELKRDHQSLCHDMSQRLVTPTFAENLQSSKYKLRTKSADVFFPENMMINRSSSTSIHPG
jgi:hypothetical protein